MTSDKNVTDRPRDNSAGILQPKQCEATQCRQAVSGCRAIVCDWINIEEKMSRF